MPESILAANTGDQAASREQDRLGFEPYVTAMARFLTNPNTRGPLTISIEGAWGSGKSSFMKQLRERLEELAADESKPWTMPLTIEFNAWRHDKAEALWAAFAVEFTRRAKRQISLWRRLRGGVLLLGYRYKWHDGWLDFARAIGMWTAIVVGAAWLLKVGWHRLDASTAEFKSLGRFGLIGSASVALLKGLATLVHRVGNPLEIDLSKFVKSPDYEKNISFVEQFHEDFSKIVRAYAGDRTVYIFIDDLDRCEVPKAAELMQALNLMMSGDQERVIFILGMDRHKVAAGLAVKHKEVLPYLQAADPNEDDIGSKELYGLQFGYNFIEKFVQIPFPVPEPGTPDVKAYVASLAKPPQAVLERTRFFDWLFVRLYGEKRHIRRRIDRSRAQQKLPADSKSPQFVPHDPFGLTEDSTAFQQITQALAETLGNNPRRIKQFVNLFRLRMFIAEETGLFKNGEITPWLLGHFIALQLRLPLLIADVEVEPGLLSVIGGGDGKRTKNALYWMSRPDVLAVVTLGSPGFRDTSEQAIRKLLTVSPRTRTIDMYDVQICHDVRDFVEAAKIDRFLRARGLRVARTQLNPQMNHVRNGRVALLCLGDQGFKTALDAVTLREVYQTDLIFAVVPSRYSSIVIPNGYTSIPLFKSSPEDLEELAKLIVAWPPDSIPDANDANDANVEAAPPQSSSSMARTKKSFLK